MRRWCVRRPSPYELELPPVIEQRIVKTLERWPWLVCEQDGDSLEYVYASEHRTRPAYQWFVDVSVYVPANARRSGVGQALYRSLFSNYCHGQRSCRNTAPAGYQGGSRFLRTIGSRRSTATTPVTAPTNVHAIPIRASVGSTCPWRTKVYAAAKLPALD
jgi:hypothetical protein